MPLDKKWPSEKTAATANKESSSPSYLQNGSTCDKTVEISVEEPNQILTVAEENMMADAEALIFENASSSSQINKNDSNLVTEKESFAAQKMMEANEKLNREQLKLTRQNSKLEE